MTKKLVLLASIGALAFGVTAQAATSNTKGIGPNAPGAIPLPRTAQPESPTP